MFGFLASVWAFIVAYYVPILLVYLAGGILYAVLKWIFKAYKLRTKVIGLVDTLKKVEFYDESIPNGNGNGKGRGKWTWIEKNITVAEQRNNIVREMYGFGQTYPPKVSANKGRLFAWALFWPFNLIWTMLHDVAVETFTWMYNKFGAVLQALSDKLLPK